MSANPCSSLSVIILSALLFSSCGNNAVVATSGNQPIVTYQMGQTVQVGPLSYNVLETKWKSQLGGGVSAKIPKNRFLVIKLTISNAASQTTSVPEMSLTGANGQTYQEVTEGVEAVPKWLGVLRNLSSVQTEEGAVVFDVPLGAYKLHVLDGGEIGFEKKALIEIPLQLE
jgi:hypothetical protein